MRFSEYLQNIENINIYPLISLVIFGIVFLVAAIYAFTADKKKMKDNANIPLK